MENGNLISDLQGNIYKPRKRFKFWIIFPQDLFQKLIFTRDRISGKEFILGVDLKGKYYFFKYNLSLDMYYSMKLDYVTYDESKDIRYEWKYRHKGKKVS